MAKFITLTFNNGNTAETFQIKGDVKPAISGGTLSIGGKTFDLPTIASMDESTKRITPARDAKAAAVESTEKGYGTARELMAGEVSTCFGDVEATDAALERSLPSVIAMYLRWQEARAALKAHDDLCEKARVAAKKARENPKPKAEPKPGAKPKTSAPKKSAKK